MEKEVINSAKAPAAVGPYSQAVLAGGMLYCSGQLGIDPATGSLSGSTVAEQAEQAMRNIGEILVAAGLGFDDIVKTTCFLTDIGEFASFNSVYGKYFSADKPARSCVQVAALPLGGLVEVEVIARMKQPMFDL